MPVHYCIWTLILLFAIPVDAKAQLPQSQAPSTGYTVFLRGTPIGREDVTVQQDAAGITIASKGRLSAPLDVITRRAEVRYRSDWTPESLLLETTVGGGDASFKRSFTGDTAFVLPGTFFGSYVAIVRRLADAPPGSEYRAFLGPQSPELAFKVVSISTERMQTGTSAFNVRRFVLTFAGAQGVVAVNLYADDSGTLLRVNIPAQGIDVVRDDLASSTARTFVHSNPGDEPLVIPSSGFNLGATLTRPPRAAERMPAVILVASPELADRDGAVAGVPILGQLAGALAGAGFLAVRYDPRGYGQSGGRIESATVGDFADDARAVVRWLAERREVDRNRIAVLGYSEGAWVALLAASRDKRIAAVVSIAAPSTTGTELVLERQRSSLEQLNAPAAERDAKVALQNKINAAVLSGRGWEGIPADIRARADTPWFQSLLSFDPARVIEDVRQPLLFMHGQLDHELPVAHVDKIAELARTRSDSKSVSIVSVKGVNHLLVPAVTGEFTEYASLPDRNVSADVNAAINGWLAATFAKIR
jgi:pimeloyl-ACP methyl ester carboxylesterase